MNQIQAEILASFPECLITAKCPVQYNAIDVVTPLGEFYITASGTVTDAGEHLSKLQSTRRYEDFLSWPDKEAFLGRYSIKIDHGELICSGQDNLLGYLMGLEVLNWVFKDVKFEAEI